MTGPTGPEHGAGASLAHGERMLCALGRDGAERESVLGGMRGHPGDSREGCWSHGHPLSASVGGEELRAGTTFFVSPATAV